MTTVVHIAGPVEGKRQLCSRCGFVLIDVEGTMGMHGGVAHAWPVGSFVGRSSRGEGTITASFTMAHDAAEMDERRCDEHVI